jgi:hypothetical protein
MPPESESESESVTPPGPAATNGAPVDRRARGRRGWVVATAIVVVGLVLFAAGRADRPGVPGSGSPGSGDPSAGSTVGGSPTPPAHSPAATPRPTAQAPGEYILIDRVALESLPMDGPAWESLLDAADGSLGRPNLANQDARHPVRTLAAALVYARTGDAEYREKARDAIMRAIDTVDEGAHNSVLSLGRQLAAYVLAADFIELSGADDETFRAWLDEVRTRDLGGHGRWKALTATHEDSPNNWGNHAGAARAAVATYLGDSEDLARTAEVFRGWLGDRSAYDGFGYGDLSWQCDPEKPVGINPIGCTKDGVVIDGALPEEMRRGDSFRWPPVHTGYAWEGMQGALLQAELLYRAGYDTWNWSDQALLRAAEFLYERAHWPAEGDDAWQPWLIDARYGTSYRAAAPAAFGKNFGFTDWLYGSD